MLFISTPAQTTELPAPLDKSTIPFPAPLGQRSHVLLLKLRLADELEHWG